VHDRRWALSDIEVLETRFGRQLTDSLLGWFAAFLFAHHDRVVGLRRIPPIRQKKANGWGAGALWAIGGWFIPKRNSHGRVMVLRMTERW
jgi:hypothetical protein